MAFNCSDDILIYAASWTGYASLHENSVIIVPQWSILNPWHGSCPLIIALVPVICSHFFEMSIPKYLPKPLLEFSQPNLFSIFSRGSLHNISSITVLHR